MVPSPLPQRPYSQSFYCISSKHVYTEVAISRIVHYELAYGVCNSTQPEKNQANLDHFLKYVQVLDWGADQATSIAQIRCDLQRIGQPIGSYDLLIAAHARSLNAVLITHNTREFSRVEGLRLEDWELD